MACIAGLLSKGTKNYSSASIAFFFVYMLIFGGTVNVVPWVYVSAAMTMSLRHVLMNDSGPGSVAIGGKSQGSCH